jgi:uncharacterized membrane protein
VSILRRVAGEEGTIVLWLLGLCVTLLFIGGISLDLWRVLSERRALAGMADTAAIAGATGIDEDAFRTSDVVVLDPGLATSRARASLAGQSDVASLTSADARATTAVVTVTLRGSVPLTLLRVLVPDRAAIPLQVQAVASPRRG